MVAVGYPSTTELREHYYQDLSSRCLVKFIVGIVVGLEACELEKGGLKPKIRQKRSFLRGVGGSDAASSKTCSNVALTASAVHVVGCFAPMDLPGYVELRMASDMARYASFCRPFLAAGPDSIECTAATWPTCPFTQVMANGKLAVNGIGCTAVAMFWLAGIERTRLKLVQCEAERLSLTCALSQFSYRFDVSP